MVGKLCVVLAGARPFDRRICDDRNTHRRHRDSRLNQNQTGTLLDDELFVHFPIPMKNAWDCVTYTCSLMLVFQSETQVDEWCASRALPKGDVRPIKQVWPFAVEWYAKHAAKNWQKCSVADAVQIFDRHQLTHSVWQLEQGAGRF
jgi:hypothetical protein